MNKPITELISDQFAQMAQRIAELEAGLTEVITWAAARDYKSIDKGGENIERLKYIERHARKALEG